MDDEWCKSNSGKSKNFPVSQNFLDLCRIEPPEVDEVIPGFSLGMVGAILGPAGIGKSFLAFELATQVAGGRDLLGLGELKTGKVVYLSSKDDYSDFQYRIKAVNEGIKDDAVKKISDNMKCVLCTGSQNNFMDAEWRDILSAKCEGARLLIIDKLSGGHMFSEDSSSDMYRLQMVMEGLARKMKCAILFTSNTGSLGVSRGLGYLLDNIRCYMELSYMTEKEGQRWRIEKSEICDIVRLSLLKQPEDIIEDFWLERAENGVLKKAACLYTHIRRSKMFISK